MPVLLRPATVTDLPFVYRGELGYIQAWEPTHEQVWRNQLERHLSRWVEHFDRLTVAVIDQAPVGYVLWAPQAGSAELFTLHVSTAHRRQGIGQQLLKAYLHGSAAQGFRQWVLSVRPDNPARLMYETAGFCQDGVEPNGYWRYRLDRL